MNPWQKGLKINGRWFEVSDLREYCLEQNRSGSAPPWKTEVCRFILDWLGESSEIVQHTSGTTGKSKEIRVSKGSMMASAENTCRYFHLEKGQTALLCLPATYIAGRMMIVRSMAGGLDLCLTAPDSKPDLSALPHIDFAAMVPLQVMNILQEDRGLQTIGKLIIGGTGISPALEKQLQLSPVEAFATFGMTETCSHVAVRRLNGPACEKAYHAMPGIRLATDERGCLVIDAPYLPAKVITNDLVQCTEPGSFVWKGRYDNLINSGGIKIVAEEMEELISIRTGLGCAVVGLPDEKLGQKPVLVLEKPRSSGMPEVLPSDLHQWFPHKRQIREIFWVDELPRNPSRKIDRNKVISLVLSQNS